MKFGICIAPEKLPETIQSGIDYVESYAYLIASQSDESNMEFADELKAASVKSETFCVLFPGDTIPLAGENVDKEAIKEYADYTLKVLKNMFNASVVVFGSGGARRCPEGFPKDRALNQIIEACGILAHAAEQNDIIITLEALNTNECNVINSLAEALDVVKKVNHTNFKLLVDFYHMIMEDEPAEAILPCEGYIVHSHIAGPGRYYPQPEDADVLMPYIAALKKIGYNGRMSIEATEKGSLKDAIALLRRWTGE